MERIDAGGTADVIYAVSSEHNGKGNWLRSKATVQGGTLVVDERGLQVRYTLSPTGRMRGIFGDNERFAVLQRQELADLKSSPDKDWFLVGDLQRLQTDLVEDQQAVELATVIYKPAGDGPFPLAMIHHGSTGTGKQPVWFRAVWYNDWLADILNEHGWIAAFPQRRGRGGSDGLYDEGFAEDRSQGYSTNAAISIAGADRALDDANAALSALQQMPMVAASRPALLAGFSRGGVVAIMQAGQMPGGIAGVINFAGGWIGEGCCHAAINPVLFQRIGAFKGPVLSIYGEDDAYYSIAHSRSNIAEMEALGAKSKTHIVKLPGFGKGHWVVMQPNLWEATFRDYLDALDP
ncbi:MAG: hypothetical protein AAF891_00730 [Pseudomonadota bacterium]